MVHRNQKHLENGMVMILLKQQIYNTIEMEML